MANIGIIGSGYGGLATAALLAKAGHEVHVFEKNEQCGGRARMFEHKGFRFDMGPSWYLMPDVFKRFFDELNEDINEHLTLTRLDPAYRVFFSPTDHLDIRATNEENKALFDSLEENGGTKLKHYLEQSQEKYDLALKEVLYKEYRSVFDFFSSTMVKKGRRFGALQSLHKYVSSTFTSERAQKILEYSIVFLGGSPHNTPALYSLMSHCDFTLGVWYPQGGMNAVAVAIESIAKKHGAIFHYNEPAIHIHSTNAKCTGISTTQKKYTFDAVIANADYHHVETSLLDKKDQQHPSSYWEKRVMAPSALIFYLGLNTRIEKLDHHNLFLQPEWNEHFTTLFDDPQWPSKPSYYVCAPSKKDRSVAPMGCENLFVLVPLAAGLIDTDESRDKVRRYILKHLSAHTGVDIESHISVERSYCLRDFNNDYNAYKGTALGLAHTLRQTANFRPQQRSRKLKGLYYVGQYTHPGIGVPMCLIGAQIVSNIINGKQ